jgi:hypothetical protein
VIIAGIWLAATCPFVANYSAVILTEVLVTFVGTAALIFFVLSLMAEPTQLSPRRRFLSVRALACAGAFLTGLASLVRPEMPLLLGVAGTVFAVRWWKRVGALAVIVTGTAMAGAFLMPMAPWAIRNFLTLHEVQIVAPRYATLPGEYAPVGYFAWTKTWLVRYRDVYTTLWPVGDQPVNIGDMPAYAFDSPEEKERVADLLDQYNNSADLEISPEVDRGFAEIARERTARHPFRTYLFVPAARVVTMWFTPRTELLPISTKLWPISANWELSPPEYLLTIFFAALGCAYVALAVAGIWRARDALGSHVFQSPNYWGIVLVVSYMVIRTAFLTTVEAPEPRYILPCYPAVLALGALVWMRKQE